MYICSFSGVAARVIARTWVNDNRPSANAADVASQMVRPSRFALIQSALGTRTPDVVPFQVKMMSVSQSTLARSGISP